MAGKERAASQTEGAAPDDGFDAQAYLASNHVPKRVWPERLEPIDSLPYTAARTCFRTFPVAV